MYKKSFFSTFFIVIFFILFSFSYAQTINKLTTIEGVRENELIGYGLVVGLPGTGDSVKQSPFTFQTLYNLLHKLGINVSEKNKCLDSKNTASVVVTATLPPFIRSGQKINVEVSSIGNSTSLSGGTLLLTPLLGLDNKTYAIAQGSIPFFNEKKFSKAIDRHNFIVNSRNNNVAILKNSAIVEKSIDNMFGNKNFINFQLNKPDIIIAQKISDRINVSYKNASFVLNPNIVQVNTNNKSCKNVINMISNIEKMFINTNINEPKIIINNRTGLVISNSDIKVGSCTILSKHFSLLINTNKNNIPCFSNQEKNNILSKKTNSQTKNYNDEFNTVLINNTVDIHVILSVLNKFHITPAEIISILTSMKDVGALPATLEIRKQ
ncbi:Flagellar P-ring protein [Buchnera aphidicola (Anoecia corni)]|uniref:Flagellar P-ring protein n=1 Tax=Buchnera aphidicola (Anoecia corni) TaxID=2994477 RepID=A0AAT9IGW9_9GAMM